MIDIYSTKVMSSPQSLVTEGAMFSIFEKQTCSMIVDTFLSTSVSSTTCAQIKNALKNVVVKQNTMSMMFVFSDNNFDRFETLASEDNSTTYIDGEDISSISVMSNLLFTTDKAFFAEDIPKIADGTKTKYKVDEMYAIRVIHRLKCSDKRVISEDIVIYIPRKYMK